MRKVTIVFLCLWTGILFSYGATSIPKGESFQALEQAIVEGDLVTAENLIKADTNLLKQHTDTEFMKGFEGAMVDVNEATPLHMAIVTLNPDMIKLFLQHGADPTLTDDVDWDCITYAALYSTPSILDILVSHDHTLLNYRTYENGTTLLHKVAAFGSSEMARHLTETYGLDPNAIDKSGYTPIDYTRWNVHSGVQGYLMFYVFLCYLDAMVDLPPLYRAIAIQDLETVKTCLSENPQSIHEQITISYYFDPATPLSFEDITPLQLALIVKNPDIVQFLLDNGADPRQTDAQDNDSAIYAVDFSSLECVKLLAQKYPDIFTYRTYYRTKVTPLHTTAQLGTLEIVQYLVTECGVDPAARDTQGDTAFDYASQALNIEIMEFLSSLEE